ncbi:pyruvate kinase [Xenorhabdus nematophila]|uniref:Pyruvate kinase n=1 Tax=Xenorhabdus nematophila (strain ATCC 19061 / DSM 3370 / CCUG 14189 / LMG 1036 / NCIMB 9965 / AN6) TaxID=406817 RepID=D3VEW8_XENNA|nr:pyruvate kinase [Xenorhabdus nematophila]CEE93219.1 pyruvate kinase II, glucose-stimulated [Xenorhabdus nematophila str. Anatoliense]CEF29442.1 pyruvate kinase II, glucose-stimulated [Xenorhabdus nematophila str. Websteri]AYA40288.1 pyruvate kinase [Xenorhabdus nematophila]MBA0018957.1 pyruvate kinase [Xenorhabdus nematophila]MCB4426792.1 pyruvate kinase [Xenorhabdus nematophila]
MSRRLRRTKIVTTLGPATDRDNNLEKVISAGANVVRLNFSHGTAEDHIQRANKVREIAARLGCNVAILGDLQGPKIRISTFKEGKIFLNVGDKFLLDANLGKGEGDKEKVGIDYKGLPSDVMTSDILLLDDGRVQLKVLDVQGMKVFTEVTVGGPLSNNKGINKLGGGLSAEALTEKDKEDIITAAKIGVDYLAVSFPRSGEDLNYARRLARDAGCETQIVAKVERAEAVSSDDIIDEIILASDVVMVARGDLGVEIGDPELVGVQKKLIRRARQLNRVVITATQMMESMITNPMPTRAEVMDVANAVLDGTDAVMLSAETAAGQYPAETVAAMAQVCLGAEKMPSINVSKHRLDITFESIEEAIAMSTMYAANHLKGVKAIIAMTESGRTARMMSRISSGLPIFSMSRHESTLNRTALYRGVTPVYCSWHTDGIAAASEAVIRLRDKGYLSSGDLILVTQGDQMGTIGSTNTCRVLEVE